MNSLAWKCKHCQRFVELSSPQEKANHTRWCDHNPKRHEYKNNTEIARSAIKVRHNQFSKARNLGLPVPESKVRGRTRKGIPHTEETKEHLRQRALSSSHRRLRRNIIEYNGVKLDSVWELELAKRLDSLGIRWIRPNALLYTAGGRDHHYFPDFYLVDRDLYLDPKNPHAYNVQREKIEIILRTYSNVKFLTSLSEIREFV